MTEYPRLVAIETTNTCNARCSFCMNNRLTRRRQVMTDSIFEKIVDDCRAFRLQAVEPFLNGEPFTDPKIITRLEHIRTKLPEAKLRLYTNGYALTPDKIDALCNLGVDHLYVSLNMLDPEQYHHVMGLELSVTLSNASYLVARRERVAQKLTFRMIRTNTTTLKEQLLFKAYCKRLGVRAMIVGAFNYLGAVPSNLPVPNYPCEHIARVDVLADGNVALCCMDPEGFYSLGNVMQSHVLDIFNGTIARRIREMHRSGRRNELDPCNTCNLFWPGFEELSLSNKIRFAVTSGCYFLRHHPVGIHALSHAENG